ncbi:MAG: transcriptional regulator NrdR [Candidatus Muiribacteriaceae bacterium]
MKCPYCSNMSTKVLDSRETDDGRTTRRRRECGECTKRFTTYERVEELVVRVVKQDGNRQEFDRNKIARGIRVAMQKRPVPSEKLEEVVADIENNVFSMGKKEISSLLIGEMVMRQLKELDEVAFIRFASVYKRFQCIEEFREELEKMN